MKWYYLLWGQKSVRDPLIADDVVFFRRDQSEFENGKLIRDWVEGEVLLRVKNKENDGTPDDVLMNNRALLVFSLRLQLLLKAEGITGVQFLPVGVFHPDGSEIQGYAIANVTNLLPALNLELSVYDREPDDLPDPELRGRISLIKPVLLGDRLGAYDVFRLGEAPGYVFVSERFQKVFLNNKLTGVEFPKAFVDSELRNQKRPAPTEDPVPVKTDMDSIAAIISNATSAPSAWGRLEHWFSDRGLNFEKGLGDVDWGAELEKMRSQLARIFKAEPIPRNIKFLYFGLFDVLSRPTSKPGIRLYVSGGTLFEPQDPDSLCDLPYFPENRFLHSQVLERTRELANRATSKQEIIDYALTFAVAAVLARFGMPDSRRKLRIVAGFDEGDYAVIV